MRGALAAAATAITAALCCLAIPVTVGIIGISDLAALGVNLGVVTIIASALIVVWIIWARSHARADTSGNRDPQ
jgi:membrane protein implicated in regulation of membrane protease activity